MDGQATVVGRLERPARALLGWLNDQQVQTILSGQRGDVQLTPEQHRQVSEARAAVQRRPVGVDQTATILPMADQLVEHVAALRGGAGAPYFADGWEVAVVDLSTICAFQPTVFIDTAAERTSHLKPDAWTEIAAVTLPAEIQTTLQPQFVPDRQAWVLSSPNPNLRVVGNFCGPISEAPGPGLGFMVTVLPSFLQVARVAGRYLLRDGYHRALGLIANGITQVPAFVKDFGQFPQDAIPANMLDQAMFLGERPPTLADYQSDAVAANVQLPASQKMVIIQAMEMTVLG